MSESAQPIPQFTVFRTELASRQMFDNPLWEVDLQLTFRGPSGRTCVVDGYWGGGTCYRAAFSPDEVGAWTWTSTCNPADAGLDGQTGSFECVPYEGSNRLYRHGPLAISDDGTHLTRRDGTPFFWLADTAWNGVIRGDDANWREYLEIRRRQGFTAIQFVATHWRGNMQDAFGDTACTKDSPVRICPEWFQRIDRRIEMINEFGMVAAPVMLWALKPKDPGRAMAEEDCIRLAKYVAARYGALDVAWMLGGDGSYEASGYDRWRRIGRGVFNNRWRRLVTMHPGGGTWPNEEFRNEDWFDFAGYQSGHGTRDYDVPWHTQGPPTTHWANEPIMPVINLEPNYEGVHSRDADVTFIPFHVRRACYWSTLLSPTAGVTYGHNAIWNWNFEVGPSEGHGDWHNRAVPPYRVGLETEGLVGMTLLRAFFESLPWWKLRPAQNLLIDQPGQQDPSRFIAAARTTDGSHRVIYTPTGDAIRLADSAAQRARWYDPRNGLWSDAQPDGAAYQPPSDLDWLLVLE